MRELIRIIKLRCLWVNEEYIKGIVKNDTKGRYELVDGRIRAKYGHSIEAQPKLPLASFKKLHHGTTKKAAEQILKEGLKPVGRQKVHLSATIDDAIEAGKRRTNRPIILEIDAEQALKQEIKIQKAR